MALMSWTFKRSNVHAFTRRRKVTSYVRLVVGKLIDGRLSYPETLKIPGFELGSCLQILRRPPKSSQGLGFGVGPFQKKTTILLSSPFRLAFMCSKKESWTAD